MGKTRGTVAAGNPQTAAAGAEALRAGGNAIDAICAASFAAFVVEAPLCSPAGAGAILAGRPRDGLRVLDFFAAMPGLGLPPPPDGLEFFDVTVDFGPTGQTFHVGRGSVAVPGALPGLLKLHAEQGEIPLTEVLAPAIAYARHGYTLSAGIAFIVSILEPIIEHTPGFATVFGATEGLPGAGAPLTNRPLADFLELLGHEKERAVAGPFSDALLHACGPAVGGLLTRRDLQTYRPVWRQPQWTDFGAYRLATNPPPSSGGTLVALGLQLAQRQELGRLKFGGPEHALEIAALLTAVSDIRADGYDERICDPVTASELLQPRSLATMAARHEHRRTERHLGSTTHISVLDERGGLASLTMSNGEGAGYALDTLGIALNNFLGEEDINPHGFHRLAAGRRMTTMMAPSALCRGGEPVMVVGSGGSNRIRSAILQALLAHAVWQLDITHAVQAPRLHVEGDRLWFEVPGWSEAAVVALQTGWPDATRFDALNMFFGGVHAVTPHAAAGDPRRGGATEVV